MKKFIDEKNILKSSFCKIDKNFWEKANAKVIDLPGEEWKPIPNMMYMVSNKARVKRIRYEKYCKNGGVMFFGEKLVSPFINTQKNGRKGVYVNMVDLSGKQKKYILARLVATAFVINPDPSIYIHVNHKDENPLNNLPENLEWVTPKENNNYGTHNQRVGAATKNRWLNKTDSEKSKIKKILKEVSSKKVFCDGVIFESARAFCRHFGLNPNTVGHWLTGYVNMPQEWANRGLKYLV